MQTPRCLLAAAALACAALVHPAPAAAQEEPARGGWILGGSLGLSNFALNDADVPVSPDGDNVGALVYGLRFGGFLRPDLALLLEWWEGSHGCSDCSVDDQIAFSNLGVAARYWWLERLWVEGGLASARAGRLIDGDRTWLRSGVSLFGGAGCELLQRPTHALDVQLRITLGSYKDSDTSSSSAALLLGLNWY